MSTVGSVKSRLSVPRPQQTNTSKSRKTGLVAREPRVQTESMRDFVDWIRSTAPSASESNGPSTVTNIVRNQDPFVTKQDNSPASAHGKSPITPVSAVSPHTRFPPSNAINGQTNGATPPKVPRKINAEPRTAQIRNGTGTSDLANFLRDGPPGSNPAMSHRGSRGSMAHNGTEDHSSIASRDSTRNSANSRTGLLTPQNQTTQPAFSGQPQRLQHSSLAAPEMPVRKRTRVKDPYAIDLDDEDDLLTALPNQGRGRQEESLADFLRNVEPPTNNNPTPISARPPPVQPNGVNGNAPRARANGTPNGTPNPRRNSLRANGASPNPNRNSGSHLGTTAPSPITKRKLEARAAGKDTRQVRRDGYNNTADLADFLRTSGPPEPVAPAPGSTVVKNDAPNGKKGGKFWKRKTYLDMP